MRSTTLIWIVIFLSAGLWAQDMMPKPAPELERLKAFEGYWAGSGSAVMAPGQPATAWTSQTLYEWGMGGHFLIADTAIKFAGMPEAMRFREFMGWDRENRRYVNLMVGNLGEVAIVPVEFVGDNKFVSMVPRVRNGTTEIERAVTTYTKDTMSMAMTFLSLEGASADNVTGTFKRAEKKPIQELSAAKALMPADPAMAAMTKLVGTYEVGGKMSMMPGAPEVTIKGKDVVTSLFDGSVVCTESVGTAEGVPGQYNSFAFYAWKPHQKRYTIAYLSNFGDIGESDVWVKDSKIIVTMDGLRMGEPMATRMVMTLDKDGRVTAATSHTCMGTHPPMQDFTATYKFVK